MLNEYFTVNKLSNAEIMEKKSRFIGHVNTSYDEQDALEFINSIKDKYHDATHNVYAYVIGDNDEIQRFDDDHEPSGTAGMPVLDVIKKEGLKYTVIVVTRYFGGILLGAGGLIRAYSKAAKKAIDTAGITKIVLHGNFQIVIEYPLYGKYQNEMAKEGYNIKNVHFTDYVTLVVSVHYDKIEQFKKKSLNITDGRATIDFIGFSYEREEH